MRDHENVELPKDSASAEHERYTPLKPTIWMTGVLVWATVVGLFLRVPTWAGIFLCVLTGISFLLYLSSYLYLMAVDREALISERYAVKRLPSSQRKGVPVELHNGEDIRMTALGETQQRKVDDSVQVR